MLEIAFDAGDDLGELAVVERPDEYQSGVGPLGFRPFACERREVAAVARDADPLLGRGEREHLRVGQSLESRVLGEREHVVTAVAQPGCDAAREVRVEQ